MNHLNPFSKVVDNWFANSEREKQGNASAKPRGRLTLQTASEAKFAGDDCAGRGIRPPSKTLLT